jgi:HlyD family type I secretion membrane fusion protein
MNVVSQSLVPQSGEPTNPFGIPDRPAVGSLFRTGAAAIALCLGGFGAWAALAPLSSAAMAPGIVRVETERKTVQHLEGGIIAELLVREGDHVTSGQVLVRLDDLEARALHDLLKAQQTALAAQQARLIAERDTKTVLTFPEGLMAQLPNSKVAEIIDGQERIFASGRDALQGEVDVLHQRIAQLNAQIDALKSQQASGVDQLDLINEEVTSVKALVEKGLERKPRLLALARNAAYLTGQQGEYAGRIAEAKESIAGAELEILNARRTRVEKAALELREVETQLAQVDERLAEASVKLGRRDVLAPQAGTVLSLRYHTLGGVVPPGNDILDIVPRDERLIVEARVNPTDIDVVHDGLPAKLVLSAYKSRTTPHIDGRVVQVSADALRDERTEQTYYLARVEADTQQLAKLDGIKLTPGMPVETIIHTGDHTFWTYLVQPLTDSFRRAFREQ